jgi:hypothetical protein
MRNVEVGPLQGACQNDLDISARKWIRLKEAYEEYVEVGQGEPGEEQIKSVVDRLHHERELSHARVVRAPDLGHMYKRIYLVVSYRPN